jgi:hypothetical protein
VHQDIRWPRLILRSVLRCPIDPARSESHRDGSSETSRTRQRMPLDERNEYKWPLRPIPWLEHRSSLAERSKELVYPYSRAKVITELLIGTALVLLQLAVGCYVDKMGSFGAISDGIWSRPQSKHGRVIMQYARIPRLYDHALMALFLKDSTSTFSSCWASSSWTFRIQTCHCPSSSSLHHPVM